MTSTAKPSAAGLGTPKRCSVMKPINLRKNGKHIRAHITPKTLKTVCANADLLAEVLPTAAAILAVMVVPIFSPRTIAHAMSNLIHPIFNMMSVNAIVADDDCSTSVSIVPNKRNIMTEPKP